MPVNISQSDPYAHGIVAGHEYFRKGIETGDWEEPTCPSSEGSQDEKHWHRGLDHGCDDAEAAYYA